MTSKSACIIQHVACESAGMIETALAKAGVLPRTVRVFAGEPVPALLRPESCLVVMGGPMSVNDRSRLPHLRDELSLIESALKAEAPIFGVCLGSQLLAAALGATVRPGSAKEIGWHEVTLTDDGQHDRVLGGLPRRFDALHWHGEVFDLPQGSTLLASSRQTPHQAFLHGANAYGVLFHLEATAPILRLMTQAFADELTAEGLDGSAICRDGESRLPTLHEHLDRIIAAWAER